MDSRGVERAKGGQVWDCDSRYQLVSICCRPKTSAGFGFGLVPATNRSLKPILALAMPLDTPPRLQCPMRHVVRHLSGSIGERNKLDFGAVSISAFAARVEWPLPLPQKENVIKKRETSKALSQIQGDIDRPNAPQRNAVETF